MGIISAISPRWAAEREAWKAYYEQQRDAIKRGGYDAGNFERTNQSWRMTNESAEMTDRGGRDNIRARARDLERNSDLAQSPIKAFRRNVVGRGFTVQAMTPQAEIDERLEELWEEWCKPRNCDITARQSFTQMLRMTVQRKKVDGGMLLIKCYTPGGILPFKLQAIEVDELATQQLTPKHSGNKVVGGIEYNAHNRAMGYWITRYTLDGMQTLEAKYYPETDVIFIFDKWRCSQVREISDMATVINRVRDTNEFITAVSLKQRIAACLGVFITKLNPKNWGGSGNGFNPRNFQPGTEGEGKQRYAGMQLTPGMLTELGIGEGVEVVNPGNTGTDADQFMKTMNRVTGAGMGLSYEATSRDMSQTNYSSARQGIIEDELTYDEDRDLLLTHVLTEVYETFVISAVLAGLVHIPNFWNEKMKWLKHNWVASPKPWIDPLKEAKANQIALQTGEKTLPQLAAERGREWKDVIDEMAEAAKYAAEKGIKIGGIELAEKQ